jgi:hypothetical protein
MKMRLGACIVAFLLLALTVGSATASPIFVMNHSFETLPVSGLPTLCGGNCAYSSEAIPGWSKNGTTGQWITGGYAGNPGAIDGKVLIYSNYGSIWQEIGPAIVGLTYTLQVARLHRTDVSMAGEARLLIGGVPVAVASGPDGGPGSWNEWTAVYTPTAADARKTLTILLSNDYGADQANFDNVRLYNNTVAVPEASTSLMLGFGLLILAGFCRITL